MSRKKRRHRGNHRRRQSVMLFLDMILILLLLGWIGFILIKEHVFDYDRTRIDQIAQEQQTQTETTEAVTETEEIIEEAYADRDFFEKEIYTFLQGPRSWKNEIDWAGEWSTKELAGSTFGEFGCGMCCLANIYSTLSPYECSPLDMYTYAQEVSDYRPGGGFGAIDWPQLKDTFAKCGITSRLMKKDKTYEEFQDNIEQSLAAIVLVSAYNDNTYWETTEGHYVTIWKYDRDSDTVFLGDSGNPDHNRSAIPLSYLYSAMKTSSTYQYELIDSYMEETNTWKHDGITDNWNVPNYYENK